MIQQAWKKAWEKYTAILLDSERPRHERLKALDTEETALEKSIQRVDSKIKEVRELARRKIETSYADEPESDRKALLEWVAQGVPYRTLRDEMNFDFSLPRLWGPDTETNLWGLWCRRVLYLKNEYGLLNTKMNALHAAQDLFLKGRLSPETIQPSEEAAVKERAASVFEGKSRPSGRNAPNIPSDVRDWALEAYEVLYHKCGHGSEEAKTKVEDIAEMHDYHFSRRWLEKQIEKRNDS